MKRRVSNLTKELTLGGTLTRGREKKSWRPSFFSSHGCKDSSAKYEPLSLIPPHIVSIAYLVVVQHQHNIQCILDLLFEPNWCENLQFKTTKREHCNKAKQLHDVQIFFLYKLPIRCESCVIGIGISVGLPTKSQANIFHSNLQTSGRPNYLKH